MTTNDNQLIALIIDGDHNAYGQLVDRYKDLVFTLALRMLKNREEAEEVAQDAFVKVYKSLDKFKGDSKFSTWIYRVTYNTCLDTIKKNKKHQNDISIDSYTINKLETVDNALEGMIKAEKTNLIKQCINMLPSEDSYLLTLFYFEELSLDEISEVIEVSANTIKVKLFRARKKLAVILEKHLKLENTRSYGA
ncbi:RNA polymerase sigma factor [Winogradskyella jejuensis]|uniref:RNA polymerase sigma factor n=1 Tax=Winogradskyella jejuensis TaxID=1089305 RepID=A0A1M5K0P4_9FLAO|nr:sigma-70 family RNA polymerase sigma factor [Winogradskyella jejuensis]SHG46412.1 RNA polymerase, sigma subunit, ECF family [Winogradskyella jejuensis]